MAEWIRCERDFLEEDTVIRFLEAVWDNRQPRKKGQAGKRLGEREITGEVVGPAERDGHLAVKVISSRVTEDLSGRHLVHPARPGTVVIVSIERMLSAYGRAERRAWSDEAARTAVLRSKRAAAVTATDLGRAFGRVRDPAPSPAHSGQRAQRRLP
jgi:hypothetical protein